MSNDRERNAGGPSGDRLEPLEGEAGIPDVASTARRRLPTKGIVAVALAGGGLVALAGLAVVRWLGDDEKTDASRQRMAQKPAAVGSTIAPLDMPAPSPAASAASATAVRIPAIDTTASAEPAEPIGVRRSGSASRSRGEKPISPEDAPVMLVTSRPEVGPATERPGPSAGQDKSGLRRNLENYQQHLRGVVDALGRTAQGSGGTGAGDPAPAVGALSAAANATGLFGGQLQGSATPSVAAGRLANRSLTLSKGSAFTCALKTRVVSAASGFVGCVVQRNVYSDDGRVLLIERGSHMDGEYRIASVRPGTVRIPVLWTRVRTPEGVTVDLASPGTGPLGEGGMPGHVDNRWGERIGAALLLSLIDDSVKLVVQNQSERSDGDTIVLPSTTDNTSKLAEKVLDSTINIPPLIYQNQGGIVGVVVARDLDFSSVYELKAVSR